MSLRKSESETLTPEDQFNLGQRKMQQNDYKTAAIHYHLAAEKGHLGAHFFLGALYQRGIGVKKNPQLSIQHYYNAASKGFPDAQYMLGCILSEGILVTKDERKAAAFFKLAADQGHKDAQFNLAKLYLAGKGVEKNPRLARKHLQSVANKGDIQAQIALAKLYQTELKDNENAAKYWKLAADLGNKEAQYEVGLIYQNGRGVEINDKTAAHYMELAAKQGIVHALDNLSRRYATGRGVTQDLEKANQLKLMATTVEEKNSFRQFISTQQNLDKKLMGSPSLLLKIHEKNSLGSVTTKGFYEYLLSPQVDLTKSYVPANPPVASKQRGPTCGASSLEIALAWGNPLKKTPPARKHAIKPSQAQKEEQKNGFSIRQTMKKYGSIMGEAFDIYILQKTTTDFGYESTVIKSNKDTYIHDLIKAIDKKNSLILPMDKDKTYFPGNSQGKHTHYGLAWGYIFKDNQYHFLVTQYGQHYLWSAEELLQSHQQLPKENPLSGTYRKNSTKDNYHLVSTESKETIDGDLVVPPSTLENFQYHALAIPTQENNCLMLDDKMKPEELDERLEMAVKSSDALMLKILTDKQVKIPDKPLEHVKLTEIAKINGDPFCQKVLERYAPVEQELTPIKSSIGSR